MVGDSFDIKIGVKSDVKKGISDVKKDIKSGFKYVQLPQGSMAQASQGSGSNYQTVKNERKQFIDSKHEARRAKSRGLIESTQSGVSSGVQGANSFMATAMSGNILPLLQSSLGSLSKFKTKLSSSGERIANQQGIPGVSSKSGMQLQSATIRIQNAVIRGGGGVGGGGFGGGGFRGFGRSGSGAGSGQSPSASKSSLLSNLGTQASNIGLGVGAVLGVPLAIMNAYAQMRKDFLAGQMGTMLGTGMTSAGSTGNTWTTQKLKGVNLKGKLVWEDVSHGYRDKNLIDRKAQAGESRFRSMIGTGLNASQKAQAIMAGQQMVGGGLEDYTGLAGQSESMFADSVRFSVAQGLGATAGAQMWGRMQQLGQSKGGATSQLKKRQQTHDLFRKMVNVSAYSGVGIRQRGQFVQEALNITEQGRMSGMVSDPLAVAKTMGGLTSQGYTPQIAGSITGKMQQQMGGGLKGNNVLSKIITMEALRKNPNMSMIDAIKQSESGMTDENIGLIKGSNISGDMLKMLMWSTGDMKMRESEAGYKAITDGKITGKFTNDKLNKRLDSNRLGVMAQGSTISSEYALMHGERQGSTSMAQMALDGQIKVMGVMTSLMKEVEVLVKEIKYWFKK
jgi:hypothetical protein